MAERPKKKKLFAQSEARPVELFKLHLGNMAQDKKPRLPKGLDYRKAIRDYLIKLNEVGIGRHLCSCLGDYAQP